MLGAHPAVDVHAVPRHIREVYQARFGYGTPGYAELGQISVAELSRRITMEVLARCGIADPDCVDRLVGAWAEAERQALALYADTLEALNALRAAGLKLGLITNGPSALQRFQFGTLQRDRKSVV